MLYRVAKRYQTRLANSGNYPYKELAFLPKIQPRIHVGLHCKVNEKSKPWKGQFKIASFHCLQFRGRRLDRRTQRNLNLIAFSLTYDLRFCSTDVFLYYLREYPEITFDTELTWVEHYNLSFCWQLWYFRAVARKKLMTEAMSMEDLWPRQSVHGWVLFLGIKSVYNDHKQQKWKKLPREVPRFACY